MNQALTLILFSFNRTKDPDSILATAFQLLCLDKKDLYWYVYLKTAFLFSNYKKI